MLLRRSMSDVFTRPDRTHLAGSPARDQLRGALHNAYVPGQPRRPVIECGQFERNRHDDRGLAGEALMACS